MRDFKQLQVWEKAHRLTLAIYSVTRQFPRDELYGLVAQMRRCSASIGANIAEGCGKDSNPEFGRFLEMASGSVRELEYHLLLAKDLGFIEPAKYTALQANINELQRMLSSLIHRVCGRNATAAGC